MVLHVHINVDVHVFWASNTNLTTAAHNTGGDFMQNILKDLQKKRLKYVKIQIEPATSLLKTIRTSKLWMKTGNAVINIKLHQIYVVSTYFRYRI